MGVGVGARTKWTHQNLTRTHKQRETPIAAACSSATEPSITPAAEDITPVALVDFDEDVLCEIFAVLAEDPLQPLPAANFARRTCHTFRHFLRLHKGVKVLKQQHRI